MVICEGELFFYTTYRLIRGIILFCFCEGGLLFYTTYRRIGGIILFCFCEGGLLFNTVLLISKDIASFVVILLY